MKVPYSMDESEPDLYGGMGGGFGGYNHSEDDHFETQTKWEGNNLGGDYEPRSVPRVYTQKEMDLVIQYNIKAVRQAYDEGYEAGLLNGVHGG